MSDTIDAARHIRRRDAMLYSRHPAQIIQAADAASHTAAYFPELDESEVPPIFRSQLALISTTGGSQYSTFLLAGTASTPGRRLVSQLVAHEDLLPANLIVSAAHDLGWIESATTSWPLQRRTPEAHQRATPPQRERKSTAALRVDRLTSIQASFGLPIQALAEVLGVSRPNLYKWLDASKDIGLQEANVRRLASVHLLAERWRQMCSVPLSSVMHEPLANGSTVLGMLESETIDSDAVISAFDELQARLSTQMKTRSQLRAEAGFKRRPSVRALPSDE
jgi:hypothetical protein